MTDKKTEALKLALEALEWAEFLVESDERSCQDAKHSVDKAITAIREALAEQPEPVAPPHEQHPQRWAVFCGICRREWSVPYQHPGKSVCSECEAAHGIKENT